MRADKIPIDFNISIILSKTEARSIRDALEYVYKHYEVPGSVVLYDTNELLKRLNDLLK